MSDPAPDYTIVVPAFNEERMLDLHLPRLLAAVDAIETHRGEVVVVDNNSTDSTAAVARRHGARAVFEPVNQISRARNRGAQEARGRHILFVDADTHASRELIERALAALDSEQVCGGGAVIGMSDPAPPQAQRAIELWNRLSRRMKWAAGSFVFCRKDAWADVGGFSHKVFAAEEILFSKAIGKWGRARGQRFAILPLEADTSMRKLAWHTPRTITFHMLRLIFFPWLLRSRRFCRLWYERPDDSSASVGTHTQDSGCETI